MKWTLLVLGLVLALQPASSEGVVKNDERRDTSSTTQKPVVNSIAIYSTINQQKIGHVTSGQKLDICSLKSVGIYSPSQINFRAWTTNTKSVDFTFNSAFYRRENYEPFALCGDSEGNYYECTDLKYGYQCISAKPFSSIDGQGTAGNTLTVCFDVVGCPAHVRPPVRAPVPVPVMVMPSPSVTSFELINTVKQNTIRTLTNSETIDVCKLASVGINSPSQLNFRAVTTGNVESVQFNKNSNFFRNDNMAFYSLCGDNGGFPYYGCSYLTFGYQCISARACTQDNAGGVCGNTALICFTIVGCPAPARAPIKPPSTAPISKPTNAPIRKPTKTPTKNPTRAPISAPTKAPIRSPTKSPTYTPIRPPTRAPISVPTKAPISSPTKSPTYAPIRPPTRAPIRAPTKAPISSPTRSPTYAPIRPPTRVPISAPTKAPISLPTKSPTYAPIRPPTMVPISAPTRAPTIAPTKAPASAPTLAPVRSPTRAPLNRPTIAPIRAPTHAPFNNPTNVPIKSPTATPITAPISAPTKAPTNKPIHASTTTPVRAPTSSPIKAPTLTPNRVPSNTPISPPVSPPVRAPVTVPVSSPTVPTSDCSVSPLGLASLYSLFIFTSVSGLQNNQGNVAIGGNANLKNPNVQIAGNLIVNGNLFATTGQVAGKVTVGGTNNMNASFLAFGGTASGRPIEILKEKPRLQILSQTYATYIVNGNTSYSENDEIILTSDTFGLSVFTVNGIKLSTTKALKVIVPLGVTVLINVIGTSYISLGNYVTTLVNTTPNKVLWNMPSVTHLQISNINIQGSVLAPNAAINYSNGSFNGTIIGTSWTGNGLGLASLFNGCIPLFD